MNLPQQQRNGQPQSSMGFSQNREEIIDQHVSISLQLMTFLSDLRFLPVNTGAVSRPAFENKIQGSVFKQGYNAPGLNLSKETFVPRVEAISIIKRDRSKTSVWSPDFHQTSSLRQLADFTVMGFEDIRVQTPNMQIETDALARIDQYRDFALQLKEKYNVYEKESEQYYQAVLKEYQVRMKTQLKEKEDLLTVLKKENSQQQVDIKEMQELIQTNEQVIEQHKLNGDQMQQQIEEHEGVIEVFKAQIAEIERIRQNRQEQEIQAVEEVEERKETEVEQVDFEEFNTLKEERKRNKDKIVSWYKQFENEKNRKPELEDLEEIQGLASEYQNLRLRYTHLKKLLLEQGILTPDVSKFKVKPIAHRDIQTDEEKRPPSSKLRMNNFIQQEPDNGKIQLLEVQLDLVKRELSQKEANNKELLDNIQRLESLIGNNLSENKLFEGFQKELEEQKKLVLSRDKQIEDLIQKENLSIPECITCSKQSSSWLPAMISDLNCTNAGCIDILKRLLEQEALGKALIEQRQELVKDLELVQKERDQLLRKDYHVRERIEMNEATELNESRASSKRNLKREESKAEVRESQANSHVILENIQLKEDLEQIRAENQQLRDQLSVLQHVAGQAPAQTQQKGKDPVVKPGAKGQQPQKGATQKGGVQQIQQNNVKSPTQPQADLKMIEEMKSDNERKAKEIETLNSRLREMQSKHQQELMQLASENADVKNKLLSQAQQLPGVISPLQLPQQPVSEQKPQVIQQIIQAPAGMSEAERIAFESLQAQSAAFQQKILKKKEKIKAVREQQAKLNQQMDQLNINSAQQLQKTKDEYEAAIQKLQQEIEQHKRDIQRLQQSGQSSMQSVHDQHRKEKEDLIQQHQGEIAKKEQSIDAFKVQLEKNERARVQLQDQVNDLQIALDDAKKKEKQMSTKLEELSVVAGDAARLKEEVTGMTKELKQVKSDFTIVEVKYKEEQMKRKQLHNQLEDMKGKIRVYCRVRPLSKSELEREESNKEVLVQLDEFTLLVNGKSGPKQYIFDSVFGTNSTQEQVFEETKRLIQSAVDGFNVCIFAYGQTGSGKTFTVQGIPSNPGVTPRSIDELFTVVESMNNYDIKLRCYMVELYLDELRDLLLPKNSAKIPLEIKESATGMVIINGVSEVEIHSVQEANRIFNFGLEHRMTRQTKMNDSSSRSHLVFAITVDSYNRQTRVRTVGKISLVDLAGSEKASKTGTDKQGAEEGRAINQSLSALGNVIQALSDGRQHIPYRDHPLTKLMKDSLGGTAKTLMFVNVSPSNYNESESKNSMDYATRVKKIKNKVEKNVESKASTELKTTVIKLEGILDKYKDIIKRSNLSGELEALEQMLKDAQPQFNDDHPQEDDQLPSKDNLRDGSVDSRGSGNSGGDPAEKKARGDSLSPAKKLPPKGGSSASKKKL